MGLITKTHFKHQLFLSGTIVTLLLSIVPTSAMDRKKSDRSDTISETTYPTHRITSDRPLYIADTMGGIRVLLPGATQAIPLVSATTPTPFVADPISRVLRGLVPVPSVLTSSSSSSSSSSDAITLSSPTSTTSPLISSTSVRSQAHSNTAAVADVSSTTAQASRTPESPEEIAAREREEYRAYQCAQQLEDITQSYEAMINDILDYLSMLRTHPSASIFFVMYSPQQMDFWLTTNILLSREQRNWATRMKKLAGVFRKAKCTSLLPSVFSTLLQEETGINHIHWYKFEEQRASLDKSPDRIDSLLEEISTDPRDMERYGPTNRFLAQCAINQCASRLLLLKTLWRFLNPGILSQETQRLLRCSPTIVSYLRGEITEPPAPHRLFGDAEAYHREYCRLEYRQRPDGSTGWWLVHEKQIQKGAQVLPPSIPGKQQSSQKNQKGGQNQSRMKRSSKSSAYLPYGFKSVKMTAAADSTTTTTTTSLPSSSSSSSSCVLQDITATEPGYEPPYIPPVIKTKLKRRGLADPSRAPSTTSEMEEDDSIPFEALLPEEFASFWWATGEIAPTYENFARLFAREGGRIDESTGSSHCKLLYRRSPQEPFMVIGGIWKYHGSGMDRFGPHSLKHLLRHMERINRIPWRYCQRELTEVLRRYLPAIEPRWILNYLHCRVTLSADETGQIL